MANQLITIEQAAEDLRKVIANAADEAEREGIAPEVFSKALSMYFAGLGGFTQGDPLNHNFQDDDGRAEDAE